MTITLDEKDAATVRRRAAEAGYDDVRAYVLQTLTGDDHEVPEDDAASRRAEARREIEKLRNAGWSGPTWEEIAAETRSEVY